MKRNPVKPGRTDAGFEQPPCGDLALEGGIHVWRFFSDSIEEVLLDAGERVRAAEYHSATARAAFIAGRSGIRRAASRYTKVPPGELRIAVDAGGKPYFENAPLQFNLSHSGTAVVAAFSEGPVGLDIEAAGRCRDFQAIARRFFHEDEADALPSGDEEAFLNLWTAKEAMLKLSGEGLSGGLREARPGDGTTGSLCGRPVHLRNFTFGNYVGAVASFFPFEVKGWFQI